MAKILGLGALLLVSLLLNAGNSLGAGDTVLLDENNIPITSVEVGTAHFGGFFFGKPWFSWWQPSYCGWDYWTTGVFEIVFNGGPCSQTYARNVARTIRQRVGTRTFSPYVSGSIIVDYQQCAWSASKKLATYTFTMKGSRRTTIALRQGMGRSLAAGLITGPALRGIAGLSKGAKFVSSTWITDYWCSGCIVEPAPKANITYNCTLPVATGGICAFTCDNLDEVPVAGTEPICVTSGLKKTVWAIGANGTAACEPAAAAGCTTAPTSADPNVVFDACTPGALDEQCGFTCEAASAFIPLTNSEGPTCDGTDWIDATTPAECVQCNVNSDCPVATPVCTLNECGPGP